MAYFGKYQLPKDLIQDQSLSDDEKVKILEQWRYDEKCLLRATGEGMKGHDSPDIFKQFKEALISLQKD